MADTSSNPVSAREARNAYMRAWRKAHPEQVRAANERYWLKRAQQKTEANAEAEQRGETQEG